MLQFMSIRNQKIYNQTDITDSKPLTLRLSYIPKLVPQISAAIDYVLSKLDFRPAEIIDFTERINTGPISLSDHSGNTLTLLLNELDNNQEVKHIIIHTDDCLRDYHKYIIAGVEFINRPEYTNAGLQVDFLDNRDNRYTLLEERIYTDC